MPNKYTRPIESTLLKSKLAKLATTLEKSLAATDVVTKEAYLRESNRMISSFYSTLNKPNFEPEDTKAETLPNIDEYNGVFMSIRDDLEILFSELENVEALVLGNFNFMVSDTNRVNRKLKEISSKLGDFILYTDNATRDAIFFKDSFNNTDKISVNSELLNSTQCEINQAEGIVTLPVDRSVPSIFRVLDSPIINPNSNGVAGNNQEIGSALNGNILTILDSNPDTWFEYERVLTNDDGIGLVLDLTVNLGTEKIINFIRINPNNFGTRTQISIQNIETSIDGKTFVSIKDDIPIAGFTTEDEENVFTLAPSTSKFSGQGLYTFTPRKAKYVHITFKQNTPYLINTPSGQRFRYAIGIRDIDIHAVTYQPSGEVVSVSFSPGDEVRKVLLNSNQNPSQTSQLASIEHRVSPDGGLSWYEIQPKEFTGSEVPEIITFNGASPDAIVTSQPVNTLLYKATLNRNSNAFKSGVSSLREVVKTTTELHSIPSSAPFSFDLNESPVDGTIQIIDPSFGSRGNDKVRYNIGTGLGDALSFRLPWSNIEKDFTKTFSIPNSRYEKTFSNPEIVEVEGREWTRVDSLSSSGLEDEHYVLDYVNGVLDFGDGRNNGKAPPGGSKIDIRFTAERIAPSPEEDCHIAKLDFTTSGDKNALIVERYDLKERVSRILRKQAKVHRLEHKNIVLSSLQFSDIVVFNPAEFKPFENGTTELIDGGDWSIDVDNGIIYSFSETSSTDTTTIDYIYQPIAKLTDNQWEFVEDTSGIKSSIKIKEAGWNFLSVEDEDVPEGLNLFELGERSVVQGSVRFSLPSGITAGEITAPPFDPFRQEVPFIDGHAEFSDAVEVNQLLPASSSPTASKVTIQLSVKPKNDLNFPLYFNNTDVFINEETVLGSVDTVGDYHIDFTTGLITLFTSSTSALNSSQLGTVNYFYSDTNKELIGLYSIDYADGTVHTYTTTPIGAGTIQVNYEYSNYLVTYNIARVLPKANYEVDLADKRVTIKDPEILENQFVESGGAKYAASKYYQVIYDFVESTRDAVRELERFFTPILKDYSLKILTKGRIF